jgi:hypothetical protein
MSVYKDLKDLKPEDSYTFPDGTTGTVPCCLTAAVLC